MSRIPWILGAHRGGRQFVFSLSPQSLSALNRNWIVADPKDDRAESLARFIPSRFPGVQAEALPIRAQEAVQQAPGESHLILATDTLESIRETLMQRERRPATFQIVGRGPGGNGGVRLGFQGTLLPGDAERAQEAWLLLDALEGMSKQASSRALTQADPLTASLLAPLRERVTERSARHVEFAERDPWDLPGGPLGLELGGTLLPARIASADGGLRFAEQQDLAMELAGSVPMPTWGRVGGMPTVLVVLVVRGQPEVQIFSVTDGRRRRVTGRTRLGAPPQEKASITQPAVFTD